MHRLFAAAPVVSLVATIARGAPFAAAPDARRTPLAVAPLALAAILAVTAPPAAADTLPAGVESALARPFGLYPGPAFRIGSGRCGDCSTIRQALFYFLDETIALPVAGEPVAAFARNTHAYEDLQRWVKDPPADLLAERPPLVWIGAPHVVDGARLEATGREAVIGGRRVPFAVVPKIPENRSYFNEASARFLADRPLRLRGVAKDGGFVARTVWPGDWRLPVEGAKTVAIDDGPEALRRLVRATPDGGAQQPFAAIRLWARGDGAGGRPDPGSIAGKPVFALMLNGAQGDDDEAHGGHFALVTGSVGPAGEMADWLVANFYSLDIVSEKGILAALTPLDMYQGDLNSGQSWYRPSYMMVAVLSDPAGAAYVQGALGRVYNQFYRHQLAYEHSTMNCTGISVDVLRGLGWDVPARGASSWPLAVLALPAVAALEREVEKGRIAFDYLTQDRTRLYPAAAFEEIGAEMLRLARTAPEARDSAAQSLIRRSVESIWFVRLPQIPSSRVFGSWPIVQATEYHARVPTNPADRKIIPVPPREFPDALRDPDVKPPARTAGQIAVVVYAVVLALLVAWLVLRVLRR
jgi:hypothetical protein